MVLVMSDCKASESVLVQHRFSEPVNRKIGRLESCRFLASCIRILGIFALSCCGLEGLSALGQNPSYPLPAPTPSPVESALQTPVMSVPNSSSAPSASLSWRGVNYPTQNASSGFALPPQSQIEHDFGVTAQPDAGLVRHNEFGSYTIPATSGVDIDSFEWQVLPRDIMYRAYLGSQKESRLAGQIVHETDHDALWDGWAGGRFGLVRYGNKDPFYPQGMQVDIEAAGLVRLDIMNDVDVQSVDFRAGVPISFGWGRHQTRIGYYHLSSHTGDEFMLKNPTHERLNFARDVLFIGHGYYLTPELRIYGEAGWAFYADVAQEWEFQFGLDYSPRFPTGSRGVPFFALHGHLREEVDFGGGFTAQVGWAWKGEQGSGIFRTGLHYYNGFSPQYSFYDEHEQQIGFGVWYDF